MSQLSIQRQWRLLDLLHGKRLGCTAAKLLAELGTSRATLYRDLRVLQEAGLPIAKEEQNGEIRYRLLGEPMPAVQPTVRQVLALRLARRMLAPLEGTTILRELDALLPRRVPVGGRAPVVEVPVVDVEVRISPRGARFVKEWPLVRSQQLEAQPDGSVVVRAPVAGVVEAMRWVLRWGKDAIVLEPPELRTAVLEEHRRALEAYDAEGVSRA